LSKLDDIFTALSTDPRLHVPGTGPYLELKAQARAEVERLFRSEAPAPHPFGPFGPITLPYTRMGAIDSLDLFGLDELIIFAFYNASRARYTRVLDVGANLGLHSIILAACGFEVRAYEPDPRHYELLSANLKANQASRVQAVKAAVSTADGEAEFVRVLGNTTGSHLAGAKNSYGEREFFKVRVEAVAPLFGWASLAKIDAEGHERQLLLASTRADFGHLDVMVEVGSAENAAAIFEHMASQGVGMYPQKLGWQAARSATDLPTSHRDGSLFLSAKGGMPW
jgi:FkbM family methyltransferase